MTSCSSDLQTLRSRSPVNQVKQIFMYSRYFGHDSSPLCFSNRRAASGSSHALLNSFEGDCQLGIFFFTSSKYVYFTNKMSFFGSTSWIFRSNTLQLFLLSVKVKNNNNIYIVIFVLGVKKYVQLSGFSSNGTTAPPMGQYGYCMIKT